MDLRLSTFLREGDATNATTTRDSSQDMAVSKNGGTPKWMVIMENPIKMDDLGVPSFSETPIYSSFTMIFQPKRYPKNIKCFKMQYPRPKFLVKNPDGIFPTWKLEELLKLLDHFQSFPTWWLNQPT